MGTYLNPGNAEFARIIRSEYVDKTGMIGLINATIDTTQSLTCISRPRRFGKSFAAQMLCAYYDKTCDSSELFDHLEIAKDPSYRNHMNRYDVIYVDMAGVLSEAGGCVFTDYLRKILIRELSEAYAIPADTDLLSALLKAADITGNRFIMIVDEWDAPVRENPELQETYLRFLRVLFKNSGTTGRIFAAVYMTGILPITKDGSQSALSNFQEYTMIKPRAYSSYVGFTEDDVSGICDSHATDFHRMKSWYDGYHFPNTPSVYNPNSVMRAIQNNEFDSYWSQTTISENLLNYISLDYDGLSKTVAELLGGIPVKVNTLGFNNDLVSMRNRDDVLTLLIHLGYLSYDADEGTVHIPNEEIRLEFARSIRQVTHAETVKRVQTSDNLIEATIRMDERTVASGIEAVHAEEATPLFYNSEGSLRSVIKLAYFSYKDHYMQLEELPAGEGYADLLYLPKQGSAYPALLVELKWNQKAESAINQIKEKKYPTVLRDYKGEVLLVGISYEKTDAPGKREHQCRIERWMA